MRLVNKFTFSLFKSKVKKYSSFFTTFKSTKYLFYNIKYFGYKS